MSLLGHDALGHWALGHPPDGASTTTLTAAAGAFTITGFPVSFTIKEAITVASYSISATATPFKISEAVSAGSFSISGKAASFSILDQISSGAYTITGYPVNEIFLEAESAAAINIAPVPVGLARTGFDYDFQQGGIGHLKYEIEEAKRLAAITRRGPPGFVDLRSQPAFQPFGGAPGAAPAPDLQAIAGQAAQAQMQAAAAAKKRRDIEAILLLAA